MEAIEPNLALLFLDTSRQTLLGEYWPRLQEALQPLSDEQIWARPNTACNSVGNLLLHLNGNVRQWLLSSFDRTEDARNRPAEFAQQGGIAKAELLAGLGATLEDVSALLARLTEAELLAGYEIQGYHVTGLYAVYHVVEHFGMHYGQILYIAKMLTGADLGFYKELNQTGL